MIAAGARAAGGVDQGTLSPFIASPPRLGLAALPASGKVYTPRLLSVSVHAR